MQTEIFFTNCSKISDCSNSLFILIFLTNHANCHVMYFLVRPFLGAVKILFHLLIIFQAHKVAMNVHLNENQDSVILCVDIVLLYLKNSSNFFYCFVVIGRAR